jgi:hypothetical protein
MPFVEPQARIAAVRRSPGRHSSKVAIGIDMSREGRAGQRQTRLRPLTSAETGTNNGTGGRDHELHAGRAIMSDQRN